MSPEEFAEYPISEIPVPVDIGTIRSDDISQDGRLTQSLEPPDLAPSLRSYLRVAVESRSGESLGALVFGHSSPARFTETHEAILAGIAAHAAIAMDNARLFEQAGWIQTELKRSNQELRRANQDLETFAYSASHDLLEPLRTIALSAEVLERDIGPTLRPGESAFLKRIMTAAHGMNSLLEDLLAYIRIAKSADGPPPQVSSADTLDRVLESLDRIASESGLTVTRGDLPVVLMHETQLVQILQNLITNSVKYRGKESPRVHVSAAQYDAWTVFSVSDNGIGIDPQYAEQIFGLFKRLHSRDRYPGSGIGLAICERIVEQYGGRIWLKKSAPHAGSTFCFSVPASRRRETGGGIGESKHAPASENPPPGGQ
jgi:light-regulated signal transduction histidine kinase (bacteriophytochrome)